LKEGRIGIRNSGKRYREKLIQSAGSKKILRKSTMLVRGRKSYETTRRTELQISHFKTGAKVMLHQRLAFGFRLGYCWYTQQCQEQKQIRVLKNAWDLNPTKPNSCHRRMA